MSTNVNKRYIGLFYASDFLLSLALGMIPLMTVLSYFVSSLSNTTFAYAILLGLYNISTSLPRIHIAKNVAGKENSFTYFIYLKLFQVNIWIYLSAVFFLVKNALVKTLLFCFFYLIYAVIKGSLEVLSIDIYSRLFDKKTLGKFFGYKHSLSSLAEFFGAMMLVSIFKILNIDINYGIVFFIVFILDLMSFFMILSLRNKVNLSSNLHQPIIAQSKADIIVDSEILKKSKTRLHIFKATIVEVSNIVRDNSLLSSFLVCNIVSIIGASVASFFIPFATNKLSLSIDIISIANVVWLTSKVLSAVVWGYVVDLIGAKYVMLGSRLMLIMSYIVALNLETVGQFYLLLALHGISSSALVVMAQNIFIELGNGALYSAVNSVVTMPFFVIMPMVASTLSSYYGYELCFLLSIIPLSISVVMMSKIKILKK